MANDAFKGFTLGEEQDVEGGQIIGYSPVDQFSGFSLGPEQTSGGSGVEYGVPPQAKQAVTDFMSGFNSALANLLSLPPRAVQELVNGTVGLLGGPDHVMGDPKAVERAFKQTAASMGLVDESRLDSALAHIGSDALMAAISTAGTAGIAGPAAAAAKASGPTVMGAVRQGVADVAGYAVKNPLQTFAGETGSFTGARKGGDISEALGLTRMPGEIAGSFLGGGVGFLGSGATRQSVVPGEHPSALAPGTEVPFQSGVREFAETSYKQMQQNIENSIKRNVNSIRHGKGEPAPLTRAENLALNVSGAYRRARQINDSLWAKVPTRKMFVDPDNQKKLVRTANAVAQDVSRLGKQAEPSEFITLLRSLDERPVYNSEGIMIGTEWPKTTFEDLKQLRGLIVSEAHRDLASTNGTASPLYGRLMNLQGKINDVMMRMVETQPELAQYKQPLKDATEWTT